MDRIIDAAANSPSPRKWSMKPRTRRSKTRHFQYLIGGVVNRVPRVLSYWQSLFLRDPSRGPAKEQLSLCRLRRSLATCAELLKIIPDWDPLFRQFPPSGALLHFGRHRYQRQSRHYVKARSLKQSSFSFISLRHCWELQRRQFLSSAVDSTSQFRVLPNKRTVGSLQIKNIYSRREWQAFEGKQAGAPNDGFLKTRLGGSELGGPLVACRLKFSYFVGSRLKFSIFVGCRSISVNK